jgi:hypothetical protein
MLEFICLGLIVIEGALGAALVVHYERRIRKLIDAHLGLHARVLESDNTHGTAFVCLTRRTAMIEQTVAQISRRADVARWVGHGSS